MTLPLVLAVALSAGNAEFDAEARRGACDIALRRLCATTAGQGLGTGVLARAMLDDPARFVGAAEAERACRAIYAAALADRHAAAAGEIVRQLGLATNAAVGAANAVARAVEAHFAGTFAADRAAAVAAQAKTLSGTIRPSEAELESEDEATLRRRMTASVVAGQRTPVFEENLRYVSERIVDPVIADGRRERKRQCEYLSRTRCEAYAPEAMAREIEANLRKNVAERQAREKEPAKAWGVFPGVLQKELPPVVERRAVGIVAKAVDEAAVDVSAESVRRAMSADPAAHRKADESERSVRTAFSAQILAAALAQAERAAPEGERGAFSAFVRRHAEAPELARAVGARVRREVVPKWQAVRAELAQAEAARLWPTLADRTWHPPADLADRVAARSDYASAVREWRSVPELAALARAGDGRPVMEESAAKADRAVAAAFELARSAIAAQNALVDEAEPAVLAEAMERKASFWRRTPDFRAIVGLLTDAVGERWRATRLQTLWGTGARPANAAEQHADLFPSVRTRIELVARKILEEMEKPQPVPERTPEPEAVVEEPQQTFAIVVERTDDRVTVRLEQGRSTLVERTAEARMSDYRNAVKAVSDRLGAEILRLRDP
ncbi:MAG: hypothetical protein ACI4RD_08995 [Kiritimatiellia bacterium]